MIVHAVPAAPSVGSVRPPIMGVDLGLSAEDADLSGVRNFALPSGLTDIATCKSYLASDQLFNIYEGERRRGLCVGPMDYARNILST